MKRIVALLSQMDAAKELIEVTRKKAQTLGAGVTLLYIKEERLFDLPIFGEEEPTLAGALEYLKALVREAGGEEWAVLAYEDDPVDHLLLEARREKALLVISDFEGEVREDLIERCRTPLLFLERGIVHECAKVLLVFDPAYSDADCLPLVRKILEAREYSAYLDYQIVPTMGTDLSLDPMIDTLNVEVQIEEEVMEARKKAFEALCEKEGLSGTFEVGEAGMVEDILARTAVEEAECLAFIVEDHDTLLADALPELARKARRDLLICFRDHEA